MMIVMSRCEDGGKSILVRTYIACTMVNGQSCMQVAT